MTESVAAIVVTYNRKELLCECLDALLRQTHPLDAIYVIDNASTDGTSEFLAARGTLLEERVRYVRMPRNTGGAGGFHEGLKLAFEAGYEWFWLMDDDVEPYLNGLELLLPFCARSQCIHGRRRNPDQTSVAWGEWFDPLTITSIAVPDNDFSDGRECQEVTVGCFEGMLVSRNVIAQIGFPDPDFFIMYDDTFFGYLASRVTPVLYVNVFTLMRKRSHDRFQSAIINRPNWPRFGPLGLYYFYRNRFLIARKLHNYSFHFVVASLRILVRSLSRELLISRSMARARAVVAGFWCGIGCWLGLIPTTATVRRS